MVTGAFVFFHQRNKQNLVLLYIFQPVNATLSYLFLYRYIK